MSLEVRCINDGQGNSVASRVLGNSSAVVDIDCHVDAAVDPFGRIDRIWFQGSSVSDVAARLVRADARSLLTERLLWCAVWMERRPMPMLIHSLVADETTELGF